MFLTFSNTILLVGLAGAALPLVMHLLSRARYEPVEWGAMIFLEGVEARQQYSARFNQIVLLALRMGVVGLIAVALAQPVLKHWSMEMSAGAAASTAAKRGLVLCIIGAVALALLTVTLVLMTSAWLKRSGWRWQVAPMLAAALLCGLTAIVGGRRAVQWHVRLGELEALQFSRASQEQTAPLAPQVDVAILLDCSASMEFEENGRSRLSIAQAAARQVLAGLHRGDRVSLVLLGMKQTPEEMQPSTDLQSIADRIDVMHIGHEPADVARSLLAAQRALDGVGGAARDFYVVCDRRASLWHGFDSGFHNRWTASLRNSRATGRIFVIFAGNTDAENVAVENVELTDRPAILGQPAVINVTLHNYGGTPRPALPLTVLVDQQVQFEGTVSVPAGAAIHFPVSFGHGAISTPGAHLITAQIKSVGYRDDDHYETVIDVIDPVHVLVISGDDWGTEPGRFRNESDFLRLALAPLATVGRQGADPCKVDVVPAEQWMDQNLQAYQVVVLANVERLTDAQARSIEQYVYGGGGLLVAPGSLSRVENYNEQLWRDGEGILPAELEEATPPDGAETTSIVGYDSSTPIFDFLHQRPDLMLFPTIGRYFPTTPRAAESRALAWYTSGAPFLLESSGGRGRVILMTTSLDADWNTLPLSSFYLPFVQSAVRYLAAGTLPSHELVPGGPIDITLSESGGERATIDLPDGVHRPVGPLQNGQTTEYRFTDTRDTGIYRLHVKEKGVETVLLFVVHAPQSGADLVQLTDQQWSQLESDFHLRQIDPSNRPIASVVSADREGYDLSPWALAAALLAAIVEIGLARWWCRES